MIGLKNSLGGVDPDNSSAIAGERKNKTIAGEIFIKVVVRI